MKLEVKSTNPVETFDIDRGWKSSIWYNIRSGKFSNSPHENQSPPEYVSLSLPVESDEVVSLLSKSSSRSSNCGSRRPPNPRRRKASIDEVHRLNRIEPTICSSLQNTDDVRLSGKACQIRVQHKRLEVGQRKGRESDLRPTICCENSSS